MIDNIADQSQARDGLHNPNPNPIPGRNYEPYYFEITVSSNLVVDIRGNKCPYSDAKLPVPSVIIKIGS